MLLVLFAVAFEVPPRVSVEFAANRKLPLGVAQSETKAVCATITEQTVRIRTE